MGGWMIKNIDAKISDALGLTQNIKEELLDPKPLISRPDDTLEHTDADYNQALTLCIENIDIVSVCAGTHNEESSILLVDLLEKYNISKDDKRVYFSQLLGMSDHISYNAAKKGFNVVKYVPYGPVKDVLPYLIRRAKENTSIAGQMSRELTNIIEEKKRRRK